MTNLEVPKTPRDYVETMLRSSIEADRLADENINDRWLREAHTHTQINGFIAATAMETIRRYNADAADDLADHLNRIITAGDIAGPAYRTAKGTGHDPDQWIAEFDQRAASRKAADK